jgi:hypothetical protein
LREAEGNAEASQARLLLADIRHLEPERREPVCPACGGAGQFEEAAAQKVDHADDRAAVAIFMEDPQTQDLLVGMPRLRQVARMQDQRLANTSIRPALCHDPPGFIHRMLVAAFKAMPLTGIPPADAVILTALSRIMHKESAPHRFFRS